MGRFAFLGLFLAALMVTMVLVSKGQSAPAMSNDTDKILAKMPLFIKDDPWRKDISKEPVDLNSTAIISSIGLAKSLHPDFGTKVGIPFQLVHKTTPTYLPKFTYTEESDRVPYPIPDNPIIEGGPDAPKDSDRHLLCVDVDNWRLYEICGADKGADGWTGLSGAFFDLNKISVGQRPNGWTSADAAGLPVFPGLVRFDEVGITKKIDHAIRFTVQKSRKAFIAPATHYASARTDANLPPMGMRVRLKGSVDISSFPEDDQVILKALQTYGMMLADNGSDWFISGAPDPRWNDDHIDQLKKIKGSDLEVVKMAE